jgi:hypothetical protein
MSKQPDGGIDYNGPNPESAVSEPAAWPKDREFLSKKQIDSIVYLCREDGADTTYDIVNTAIQYYTDTTPPAALLPEQDIRQISEAARHHGLTLVKTAKGYDFMKLGEVKAHNIGAKE